LRIWIKKHQEYQLVLLKNGVSMLVVFGWFVVTCGFFFIFSGIVGLYRFPDFYTKIHAASLIDSCGVPLSLIGLAFTQDSLANVCKLVLAALLILLLSPVATYALAKANFLRADNKS
jgi:multicomponent Na+:H+ antiporter subunit G